MICISIFFSDILQKNLFDKIHKCEFILNSFTKDLFPNHLNNKTINIIIYTISFCLH